jgi:micrococcal nuclease
MNEGHVYAFRARCTNVVDGDTIDVVLDVGFHCTRTERLRLLGVNAPELHSRDPEVRKAGYAAKDFTMTLIDQWQFGTDEQWPLLVETVKTDAFGRYLAKVESAIIHSDTLSNELLRAGHAVEFMVGK